MQTALLPPSRRFCGIYRPMIGRSRDAVPSILTKTSRPIGVEMKTWIKWTAGTVGVLIVAAAAAAIVGTQLAERKPTVIDVK